MTDCETCNGSGRVATGPWGSRPPRITCPSCKGTGERIKTPRDFVCPNCNAQPGQPCTQPTDKGRRNVTWFHIARETAYNLKESES